MFPRRFLFTRIFPLKFVLKFTSEITTFLCINHCKNFHIKAEINLAVEESAELKSIGILRKFYVKTTHGY